MSGTDTTSPPATIGHTPRSGTPGVGADGGAPAAARTGVADAVAVTLAVLAAVALPTTAHPALAAGTGVLGALLGRALGVRAVRRPSFVRSVVVPVGLPLWVPLAVSAVVVAAGRHGTTGTGFGAVSRATADAWTSLGTGDDAGAAALGPAAAVAAVAACFAAAVHPTAGVPARLVPGLAAVGGATLLAAADGAGAVVVPAVSVALALWAVAVDAGSGAVRSALGALVVAGAAAGLATFLTPQPRADGSPPPATALPTTAPPTTAPPPTAPPATAPPTPTTGDPEGAGDDTPAATVPVAPGPQERDTGVAGVWTVGVLLVLVVVVTTAAARPVRRLVRRRRPPVGAVLGAWCEATDLLALHGERPRRRETARTIARRHGLGELADLAEAAAFGPPDTVGGREAATAWRLLQEWEAAFPPVTRWRVRLDPRGWRHRW